MKIIPNTINIKVIFPNQDSFPSFIVTFSVSIIFGTLLLGVRIKPSKTKKQIQINVTTKTSSVDIEFLFNYK